MNAADIGERDGQRGEKADLANSPTGSDVANDVAEDDDDDKDEEDDNGNDDGSKGQPAEKGGQ